MLEAVLGVWSLVDFHLEQVETKERIEPFGPRPRGRLILNRDGSMAAILTPRDRPVPTSDAQRAEAFGNLIAYSGRFRFEPPDRFITSVDVAWFEPWVGTEQARTFRILDDNLHIVSAPTRLPSGHADALYIGILIWARDTGV